MILVAAGLQDNVTAAEATGQKLGALFSCTNKNVHLDQQEFGESIKRIDPCSTTQCLHFKQLLSANAAAPAGRWWSQGRRQSFSGMG